MDLPANIIIGNIISLIGGFFLILSMWVNDEKKPINTNLSMLLY